jgi:hypothetical protein
MARYYRVNFIAGAPPRFFRAFEAMPDHIQLPSCESKYRISEEQAALERETEAEKQAARLRRAKARAEAG